MISLVSFFIFISSIIVITSYSPITSVVYLIATFVITAIYLSSQNIIYIALTYIIVYVGAVITLFLFVVIMINLGTELSSTPFTQTIPLTMVIITLYTILILSSETHAPQAMGSLFQTLTQFVSPAAEALSQVSESTIVSQVNGSLMTSLAGSTAAPVLNHWNQIQSIGFELYTHQAIWLVLVSIVLMISMIGPIVICRSERAVYLFLQLFLRKWWFKVMLIIST